jgi:antitoxin component YwqK of YwqJK toxin-antitoxin module
MKEKGFFASDKRDGEYIAYYRSGRIKEKAMYHNGKLEGKFLTFDEQGIALKTPAWDNGEEPYESGEDIEDKEKRVEDLLRNLSNYEKNEGKDSS